MYQISIGVFFGLFAMAFNLLVSLLTTLMFETVNYLEHYGLSRKLINGSDSIYESVRITHSWNAPQVMTNYLLFKLQRHSDHHANSYKPYQILDSYPESPMLPYGYSVSMLLSLFPPVWKRVIDPVAIATNNGVKVSEETKQDGERCVLTTLIFTSMFFTYICFFAIGFHPSW